MSDQIETLESKPEFTGKRLVMLDHNAKFKQIEGEAGEASLRLASSSDFKSHEEDYVKAFDQADGIVFENFGVAVINENHQEEINVLTSAARVNSFLYDEPERFVYAIAAAKSQASGGFWQWLLALLGIGKKPPVTPSPGNPTPNPALPNSYSDIAAAYWGVQAVRALTSPYKGKNIPIAILDTGFLLGHPDFQTRVIQSKSFISGEDVNDLNGHGTHCTGVAAGGLRGSNQSRYGVSFDSNIFIGKVLSNAGSGADSGIIAGMDWAMSNGCKVISMSLGAATRPGQSHSRIYEDIAKQGLQRGTLIIAAAGNESNRSSNSIKPVGHPANCPSIMAVAAVDRFLKVANFSCGSINGDGGEVNIAGPGVAVMSAYKSPQNYTSINGTSMATPFVSGVAAQLWEQNPNATASQIWEKLVNTARPIGLPASDVGAGLVQSPQ
ncbi:S8 family serine peptidase [Cognataquiflexum rubidum]|uniref:S8 family serine peptidase n=1 Tax=Cognataquiflexum rubidum TaxID=2922273 RepID=UPI001F13AA40|nr:S8 family serine peptidase [Cognataquiflexum rubidum]MCH6236123.1 S8 family serine peptidase [Cognataquiflexum rubidum]